MSVPVHDECTALQIPHPCLSNPSGQIDFPENNDDNLLENLGLQLPQSLVDFPAIFPLPAAENSFEQESPIFELLQGENISPQSRGDKEASVCDFAFQPPPQHKLSRESNTCAAGLESCKRAALITLRKLHIPRLASLCIFQNSGERADGSELPMLDEILRINAEAMQSISRMLQCSCLEKISLRLMTCIICNKLVSVNSKILQFEEQGGFSGVSNQNYMMTKSGLDIDAEDWQKVHMSQPVVRVGNFTLDSDVGGRVRSYVVLQDLRRLRGIIERLNGRTMDDTSTAILDDLLERLDRCP